MSPLIDAANDSYARTCDVAFSLFFFFFGRFLFEGLPPSQGVLDCIEKMRYIAIHGLTCGEGIVLRYAGRSRSSVGSQAHFWHSGAFHCDQRDRHRLSLRLVGGEGGVQWRRERKTFISDQISFLGRYI